MKPSWQIKVSTSKPVPNLFRQTAAALLLAIPLSTAVWAAPAPSGRPQTVASADTVPEGLSAPEWSSIRQQYEQQRHAAYPVAGGYQARNPGQQWQTRFDGRGFTTKPEGAAWQWGLELQSYGFAGQERAVPDQPRVKTSGPRVTYDWDATLQEWYVNDRRGLEHGFTVRERPSAGPAGAAGDYGLRRQAKRDAALAVGAGQAKAPSPLRSAGALQDAIAPSLNSSASASRSGATAPKHSEGGQPSTLNFLLAVRGGLRPEVQADGRGVRFVDAQGAAALTYSELTVLDADGRKLPARFEPVVGGLRLAIDERGARYPLTIDPIAQQAYLKASNTGTDDQFGYSVAVSGDTVVVGAPCEDSNATGVDGDQSDNSAENSGAAYVFVRNGTNWTQQDYLKASYTHYGDEFGFSVAVSGDTVVVGARLEYSNATGVNGNQSNNSALNSGAAYVFVRNGTIWSQQAYLKASNTDGGLDQWDGDYFGSSVAVSGDTVVVGADGEFSSATGVNGDQSDNSAPSSGAAYVFARSGTTWTQQAYLKASNTGVAAHFGLSVSVSGDTVVVGACNEFDASGYGAAYVFVRNGTNWTQQAYLKASNTDYGDEFGFSVATSGDTVVVGAYGESSSARGVNGNQSNNSALNSGAAYVFVRNGTTWTQQAYLKASNTGGNDRFGWSVSVSGDTVVAGAFNESSSATGVNGDQSDNSASGSGAAYIFNGLGLVPAPAVVLALAPDGSGGYLLGFNGAPEITYRLQRAPSVTGPWSAIATNTAPASGRIEYHETSPPPGAAFYRTAQP
jgi:hypothetical protein